MYAVRDAEGRFVGRSRSAESAHRWSRRKGVGGGVNRAGDRLFIGVFPGGISYADRYREVHGDYKRLAFLSFNTLELSLEKGVPADLAREIITHAKKIQARRGQQYQVSSSGQTVMLGRAGV
jgi:hypothetical protein